MFQLFGSGIQATQSEECMWGSFTRNRVYMGISIHQGAICRAKIVGLLLQGHSQKGPKIHSNSHIFEKHVPSLWVLGPKSLRLPDMKWGGGSVDVCAAGINVQRHLRSGSRRASCHQSGLLLRNLLDVTLIQKPYYLPYIHVMGA